MLKLNALNQLKQLKTEIKASRNLAKGTVKGTGNKFGFVTLDSGKDVFLPPDEMQKVLPGDRIEVEIKKEPKSKTVAIIERLLESPTKHFFGKYVVKGKAHFVEADIPGLSNWIFIPPQKRKNAAAKNLVKCKLTQHPYKTGKAQAAIEEVLGNETEAGIEWRYAIAKHGISTQWNEKVEQELQAYDEALVLAKCADRKDYSSLSFVTIDASSTVDMDDALWVEKTDSGWLLRVAIADPGALIEPASEIERVCVARGTSVYFPGQQIPMVPEKLAGDLCSLVEGKVRLAKVVEMHVTADGEVTAFQIENASIKSAKKLSYAEVSNYLDNRVVPSDISDELAEQLNELNRVASALGEWRQHHALANKLRAEYYIELGEDKKISRIRERVVGSAHRLVEECMVATNRSVATFLVDKAIPGVFISHPGVRTDRLAPLNKVIEEHIPPLAGKNLSDLNEFVEVVRALRSDTALAKYDSLISRQLDKSRPSLDAQPHFGMGLPAYTTFTSPLRKANDFLVHRQIEAVLSKGAAELLSAKHIEQLEQSWFAARGAVYDVEQWLKCQFVGSLKNEVLDASVVRVFSSGFQVRLSSNGIEGFVSTKEMDGKYSFDQTLMTLKGKGLSVELDMPIKVRLKQVDWSRKTIQFVVAVDEDEASNDTAVV